MNNAIVMVTGANRGLGRALVEASLEAGARRVYATARDASQLAELTRRAPERVVALPLDITDPASLAAAAARVPDLSVLINNAGVLASSSVLTSSVEALTQDFVTNTLGTLAVTRAFLPALERGAAAGRAAIVNVLSVVSLTSMPAIGGYAAAKAASYSMTQALRAELAPRRIRVHAALPGAIDTDMVRSFAMPKTSAADVARGILEGLARDQDDILPDPMARSLHEVWQRDPKELERQLAAM